MFSSCFAWCHIWSFLSCCCYCFILLSDVFYLMFMVWARNLAEVILKTFNINFFEDTFRFLDMYFVKCFLENTHGSCLLGNESRPIRQRSQYHLCGKDEAEGAGVNQLTTFALSNSSHILPYSVTKRQQKGSIGIWIICLFIYTLGLLETL